jgi:hypothetical protein
LATVGLLRSGCLPNWTRRSHVGELERMIVTEADAVSEDMTLEEAKVKILAEMEELGITELFQEELTGVANGKTKH